MKSGIILLTVIIIMAFMTAPVMALTLEEIDTDELDIPEIGEMDFSKTPIGSLESLAAYSERLLNAAEELLDFIRSIFKMLGMEDSFDVENLLNIFEEGMNLTEK